jgi:ankyrin repeat protein
MQKEMIDSLGGMEDLRKDHSISTLHQQADQGNIFLNRGFSRNGKGNSKVASLRESLNNSATINDKTFGADGYTNQSKFGNGPLHELCEDSVELDKSMMIDHLPSTAPNANIYNNPQQFSITLNKLIFEKNLPAIRAMVSNLEDSSILNTFDLRGFTPLMLVTKLAYSAPELYYQILLILLEAGADPRTKDVDGWSAFEEAVAHQNVRFCSILFDYLSAYKLRTLTENQDQILLALGKLPDYEIHLKWEFDSSIIPLVTHFAPSDVFKIWKRGSSVRLDSTIAGYKNLTTKRRPMCVF